jgi:hypothetical protein
VYYRRAALCYAFFFVSKDLNAKEVFPVYGGKCLSLKAVRYLANKFSQARPKALDDEIGVQNWLRQ